jgi:ribosomal protein S18 acetylase RimI-like enzyme
LPEARNRGIAKSLVEAALTWLRAQGGVYIQVTVTPEGEATHGLIRFYTKLGFHHTGRTLLAHNL